MGECAAPLSLVVSDLTGTFHGLVRTFADLDLSGANGADDGRSMRSGVGACRQGRDWESLR
jgi:hypothetical protein